MDARPIYFGVLGSLSIQRDGSPVSLNAPTLRHLAALLLVKANNTVSVEDLIAVIWTDDRPSGARKALQVYVHRLRQALGDDDLIRHEYSGYKLALSGAELDSQLFDHLAADARAQRRDGRADRAAQLFRQALDLWRGPAFEGLSEHPLILDEARRLDEEHLRVEVEWIEVELLLGRHKGLIARLFQLTELHPFREDLRCHLMLALYRAGRQTEATNVYHQTRKLLDKELGLEPGYDLRQLHAAILRSSPELNLRDETALPAVVPRELPAAVAGFTGRIEPLAALDELASGADDLPRIALITGMGGVGKTALAVHWAHRVADRFPDGQLYVNLRGFDPTDPPVMWAGAMRRFLYAMGVTPQRIPAGLDEQTSLYRSLLAGKRLLLVLDNARDAEQVRPLLPGSDSCLVLLTSRNKMASLVATSGGRAVMLDVLTEAEAHQLLATRLGSGRVNAGAEATKEIITRCARLPLALAVAAAQAATQPELSLADLAHELRSARNELDAFDSEDPTTDLRAVFSWSYQQLSSGAARLFRLLSVHPGPDISDHAAASLAGVDLGQVRLLLTELTQAHLMAEPTPSRYVFHDLLRAYATGHAHTLDTEADRRVALHRILDHYLHTAYSANRLMNPARDPIAVGPVLEGVAAEDLAGPVEATAWFTAEHSVLLAAIRRSAVAGFDAHAWQLAWTAYTFLDRHGHWHDWVWTQQAALAAAERLNNMPMRAVTHRNLGYAQMAFGQYEDAYINFRSAINLYLDLDDDLGRAHAYFAVGLLFERWLRHREALEHFHSALEVYEASGHGVGLARALSTIGWQHALLGEYEQAETWCQRGLTHVQQVGDRHGEAATLDSLGYIHHNLGNHHQAIAYQEEALALFRQEGNRFFEAYTLTHLGESHQAAGNDGLARQIWQQCLDILVELDHPNAAHIRAKLES